MSKLAEKGFYLMDRKRSASPRKPQPFRTPPELNEESYAGLPLYMLIAHWALLRGVPVTVRDVRLAFDITLRRASDLLEYLTEQGSRVVEAECYLVPSPRGGKCMCRAFRVISINGKLARIHSISPPHNRETNNQLTPLANAEDEELQDLRRWIAQRRTGETVPEALQSPGDK
ncbi:CaiF/GrlA family transcriptional regulator [Trabulsiella guamensis]|uniref:CaiF/GrlA family transcriptional regulator n=1 Tax=Trabulsiella guamensis TaxID=158852 RepID=UPI001470036E|nr:CaiF/GrlA family transcriptional regulator [Trabulsiella guamensis]